MNCRGSGPSSKEMIVRLLGLALGVSFLTSYAADAIVRADDIVLEFAYGSEKEQWITDVTRAYNAAGHVVNGRRVRVNPTPMGSGEAVEEVLAGTRKAHLLSPASGAFIELGNAESRAGAGGKDLVKETKNLVLSPVVIAIWKPMAEALGWSDKPIGWADVLRLARDPKGWEALGHPEWGSFKFGHTHPEYSNSGLISVLAEVYAGAGKSEDLTVEDVNRPETAEFVRGIERSVVHYGSSTGFFGNTMFASGPQALSAAVLYESLVIESYDRSKHPETSAYDKDQFPVVAIYPKEGTFWSDHPVGVVEREWVTDDHRAAAKDYVNYLLARPQQERAMRTGFRPADEKIPLAAPLDAAHGIDPDQPKAILPVPSSDVMKAILALWRQSKKHAQVALVLDRSGSMRVNQKMLNAQKAALEVVKLLGDDDHLSLILFSDAPAWAVKEGPVKEVRAKAESVLLGVFPEGQTAMYDALKLAHDHLQANAQEGLISAIVVLSDGLDNMSKMKLDQLLKDIQVDDEKTTTRIFTIFYGTDANKQDMESIAQRTRARSYAGTPANILKVFKDIATFF
ncbi:MAG: extracellular solute-binding protein [Planctomycetaceae bacterium]|nr:extracellular solute-binding protein [Planctomycetaceae bacterium]